MTSDTKAQGAETTREKSLVHGSDFPTAERATREDQAKCRAPSPSREMQESRGWRQLRIKRLGLQGIRTTCEVRRERLRKQQQEIHAIDAQFLRKLRRIESVAFEDMKDFVVEIVGDCGIWRQARSGVASQEGEYEKLERQLVEMERELRDLESHMYWPTRTESVGSLAQQDGLMQADEDPTESFVSSQNFRRNQSLEARVYLSQKGDVDILRERLMDLRLYQSQVTAEQADRRDAGLNPDEALAAFLDGFELQYEALVLQVREAEELLAEYEDALEVPEDSSPPSEGPFYTHSLFGRDDYFDDIVLGAGDLGGDQLAAAANAFLFSPSEPVSVLGLLGNGSEDDSAVKALYINSWLLHHLRTSAGEVARLVAEHMNYGIHLKLSEFKEQVLANWLQNDTIPIYDLSRFAVHSHDYSMATVSGNTQNSRPASENVLQSGQQNDFSLQRRLSARHTQTER